jgi:ABC-type dipeptide/oligopeptide/nickel transport system permease subunit
MARPQVEAARLSGFGPWHVLRHHRMPALAPPRGIERRAAAGRR